MNNHKRRLTNRATIIGSGNDLESGRFGDRYSYLRHGELPQISEYRLSPPHVAHEPAALLFSVSVPSGG